ncbi:MAG: hypothetical protein ACNA8L_10320 [Luteolibacter sp.]
MIARDTNIIPGKHVADWTGQEGKFVETAAGADSIVNNAADIPLGVITEGLPTNSAIATPKFSGTVKVKVTGTSPGTIVRGTYLTVKSDGTVQADAGTGARVRVARALEAGAANELIEAYLLEPTALA